MGKPPPESSLLRPWHVVTTDGTFHSGHLDVTQATITAEHANQQAREMQLTTRYQVRPRPGRDG